MCQVVKFTLAWRERKSQGGLGVSERRGSGIYEAREAGRGQTPQNLVGLVKNLGLYLRITGSH